MCGIAGLCGPHVGDRFGMPVIKKMTDVLTHRGPDGEGFLVDTDILLGHRRLSIIDIAGGDQPIFNEDQSIAVIFNGEIYNYKELRSELQRRGHKFRTASDTETIVHLYEEHGQEFLQHLNGMFAIALWDINNRRLLLARDRLGEKPLYYSVHNNCLTFASELKSIREGPFFTGSIDIRAVDSYFALGYVPEPLTIFTDVRKLAPAHALVWENGIATTFEYWRVPREPARLTGTPEELEEQFVALLRSSISMRLRSDVPVASFLSGGIDSTLITAIASQEYSGVLKTFTVGFTNNAFDETQDARVVARHFGCDHHESMVTDVDLDILPSLVRNFDEPFADPSMIPTYYVTRAASDSVKVCLSGDSGDELFGGYRRYRLPTIENVLERLPFAIRKSIGKLVEARLPPYYVGAGLASRLATDGPARYLKTVGIFSDHERFKLLREEFHHAISDDDSYFSECWTPIAETEAERRMRVDILNYLPGDILTKVDRTSMQNSLEVRVPLLDHRLVEFANALPFSMKIDNGAQKVLLRKVLERLVPASVLKKTKQGFGLPIRDWFRNEYSEQIRSELTDEKSACLAFLNPKSVKNLIAWHAKGKRDFSGRIFAILCFEFWMRQYTGSDSDS